MGADYRCRTLCKRGYEEVEGEMSEWPKRYEQYWDSLLENPEGEYIESRYFDMLLDLTARHWGPGHSRGKASIAAKRAILKQLKIENRE